MIRPEPQVVKAMAATVRQYPDLLEWLATWKEHELNQLPHAVNSVAVSQGRCQVLCELYRFASESPALAAKQ